MKPIKTQIHTFFMLCSFFFVLNGNAQELQTFILEALTNNPEIKKFELQYRIASEKVNEVNQQEEGVLLKNKMFILLDCVRLVRFL